MDSIKQILLKLEPSIFLLRHGCVDITPEAFFVGQTDLPLNMSGRKQAENWRNIFEGLVFEDIISSDLSRAGETARIIATGHKNEIRILPELKEICLGEWERISVTEIKERYPGEYEARGENIDTFRPPEGENFVDLQNRVLKVFIPVLENHRGHVLIISHAGVNRVIISYLLDIPVRNIFKFAQDYGALNIITGNSKKYCVRALNLTTDLFHQLSDSQI